jgi:hypothetical protein
MKSNSATMKSVAAQRLGLPLSAACAPALIAARIEAMLIPPDAEHDEEPIQGALHFASNELEEKHQYNSVGLCARARESGMRNTSALITTHSIALRALVIRYHAMVLTEQHV